MSMAAYSLIAAIIIRFFMALAPFIGVQRGDIRSFALRGPELDEALELMGVLDSRLILYSWPLFAIVTLATRVGELGKSFTGPSVPVVFAAAFAMLVVFYLLPTRWFRGTVPPIIVLVVVSLLDAGLYFWAMDRIIPLITT